VQIVLRGFGVQPVELVTATTRHVVALSEAATVALDEPMEACGEFTYFTVEPMLVWTSASPLLLSGPVEIF
jgi:hypothetical protein